MRLPHRLALVLGLGFLYGPILVLIAFSFNANALVSVWGGFSTRWYVALAHDSAMIDAFLLSMKVAVSSGLIATVLGTCAAFALAREGSFLGRNLFVVSLNAPLVMPEVITGLSLLLLFVALDVERGFWTVVPAHATLGLCFVSVVVRSRLLQIDRTLEEAASDLGATPAQVLWRITLPLLAPAILSGFLLAFTLSLDDLVLASFTSGPGATTLPMRIFSQVRLGLSPQINALSTLMIALVAVTVGTSLLLTRRTE
jgi:putrescine transport system permease protein